MFTCVVSIDNTGTIQPLSDQTIVDLKSDNILAPVLCVHTMQSPDNKMMSQLWSDQNMVAADGTS